jgi:PAP2 superfamily
MTCLTTTSYARLGPRIVAIVLAVTGTVALPKAAHAQEPVSYWSGIAKTVIVDMAARGGSPSAVDFAYVHAAIYDAVNAIDQRYTVFAVTPTTFPDGASEPAAVAAAAATILKALFTAQAQRDFVDAQLAAYLAMIPAGDAKNRGIAVGTEVANAFLALRRPGPRQDLGQDGRDANCASDVRLCYVFENGPGKYQRTPGAAPGAATPAAQWVGILKPFAVRSQSQFRADGPPNLTSAQWAEDYNETKTFGGDAAHSPTRTQEQTDIGWYYTDNPGAFGNRIIRQIAADQHLELADSARYFAQTYVTLADTFINCWDSKRYYNFWRPVTAIVAGDTDGNDATEPDPSWLPLALTPNHQEYPSAHGCFTGSVMNAAENFFGTKKLTLNLTACSVPGHPCNATSSGVTHSFTRTQDALREVIEGRIYGGMHYRTSVVHGIVMSNKVAHYVAKHYFLPVEDTHGHAPQGPKR